MNLVSVRKQHTSLFKGFALVLGVVLLFSMLFSAFFITAEYHHDCTGEDCPICQMVALCENFVENLGAEIVFLAAAVFVMLIDSYVNPTFCSVFRAATPVRQKVRLNN